MSQTKVLEVVRNNRTSTGPDCGYSVSMTTTATRTWTLGFGILAGLVFAKPQMVPPQNILDENTSTVLFKRHHIVGAKEFAELWKRDKASGQDTLLASQQDFKTFVYFDGAKFLHHNLAAYALVTTASGTSRGTEQQFWVVGFGKKPVRLTSEKELMSAKDFNTFSLDAVGQSAVVSMDDQHIGFLSVKGLVRLGPLLQKNTKPRLLVINAAPPEGYVPHFAPDGRLGLKQK